MSYLDALEEENDEARYCEEFIKLCDLVGESWAKSLVYRAICAGNLDITDEEAYEGHRRMSSYYEVILMALEGSS